MTNGQTPQTHGCIELGTYGNRQVSLNCFDFKSGKVVTKMVFKVIPNWYACYICKASQRLGNAIKKKNQKKKLEFLNIHWKNFDWDNKELDEDENV